MKKLIAVIILSLSILCSCNAVDYVKSGTSAPLSKADNISSQVSSSVTKQDEISLDFISVGQADSIYIKTGDIDMLVDAGNNDDEAFIVDYLKSKGVKSLDYVIGTHPHEDHIGGLDAVINNFDIGTIIMPKTGASTKTYEDVLTAISKKHLKVTAPVAGTKYTISKADFTILAPNKDKYDSLNNYSVVIKVTFKNTTFLLDGDAESVSEKEMIQKGYDLKADLLKVGHHGSNSSTSKDFLNLVKPKYAVISVGKGNDYGHPTANTLNKLKAAGAQIFRTDTDGTITAVSDGNNIIIKKAAAVSSASK